MQTFSFKKRVAATGAAGVMAVGTVAAVGAITPADATTSAPTRYVCTTTGVTAPASVVGRITLPKRVKAGKSLAGIRTRWDVTINGDVVRGLAQQLQFTTLGGKVIKASLQLTKPGTARKLPLGPLTIPQTAVPGSGDMKLTARGKTARTAHAPKQTGRYLVKMPKRFTFEPKSDSPATVPPLTCTLQGKAGNFGKMRVVRR